MDWLWPLYQEYVEREVARDNPGDQGAMQSFFLNALSESTATLFVMEPWHDTVRFKGLGRWSLPDVPALLADPNAFIADLCGAGKFKVNFHHRQTFVCTHNFRTEAAEESWRNMKELEFD